MSMKIHKGDNVKVVYGNDKGKQGKVLAVFPVETKILVEGVYMQKKHMRARQQGRKGEVIEKPMPIPVSRVMIVCGSCGKPARVGYRREGEKKTRVCRACKNTI